MVNSIDSSLNENCYDAHDFRLVENDNDETTLTGYLGPKTNPNTQKIFWTNKNPQNTGRQKSCDILPTTPKPTTILPLASGFSTITDAFCVLFSDGMVEHIINHTNAKIQDIKDKLPSHYNKTDKNTFIRPISQRELYAFIGLLYARGLLGQSMHTYKMLFSETAGHRIFSATMSKHRFSFLSRVLTFDDPKERQQIWKTSRFAAMRELTVMFNDRMKSVLAPSEFLSIDETLYAMRHQINF